MSAGSPLEESSTSPGSSDHDLSRSASPVWPLGLVAVGVLLLTLRLPWLSVGLTAALLVVAWRWQGPASRRLRVISALLALGVLALVI